MRLFIIGNGFDIDHKIKSKYKDFKEFLEQTYLPSFNRGYVTFPNVGVGIDGEEVVNPNSASQILYALVSEVSVDSDWNDFEDCLGRLNYQEILDLVEEDEEHPFRYFYNLEDVASDLKESLLFVISGIFGEWVNEIDISSIKRKYTFLGNDLFLTFNYTSVLEDIYKISKDNIYHLHGSCLENYCIIGHGNKKRLFDDCDDIISGEIDTIHELLRKDVESIYNANSAFFKKIYESEISEIIFFGFSFGEADLYYFEQLFANMKTKKVKLFLSQFEDENEKDAKINKIFSLGFDGEYFGPFNS